MSQPTFLMRGLAALLASAIAGIGDAQEASPGAQWLSYNNHLDGQRFSPLKEITPANATQLGEVCRVQIDGPTSMHSDLIVADGVIYTGTGRETVAIDATRCTLLWRHSYTPDDDRSSPSTRGVAVMDGRVFRGTSDDRLIALGCGYRQTAVEDRHRLTEPGRVLRGGAAGVGRRRLYGYQRQRVGRTRPGDGLRCPDGSRTVALQYHPHGQGGRRGNLAAARYREDRGWRRLGCDDPGCLRRRTVRAHRQSLARYRQGVSPGRQPVHRLDRRARCTHRSAQMVAPGHAGGLDGPGYGRPPVLYRIDGARDYLVFGGKDGYVTAVDRDTHQQLFRVPVTTIERMPKMPTREGMRMCPGYAGGVEWNGPAFDRLNHSLVTGAVDACFIVKLGKAAYTPGALNFGGSVEPVGATTGWITSIDSVTGEVRWKFHADKPVVAGITPTAGGVTFAGDLGGSSMYSTARAVRSWTRSRPAEPWPAAS